MPQPIQAPSRRDFRFSGPSTRACRAGECATTNPQANTAHAAPAAVRAVGASTGTGIVSTAFHNGWRGRFNAWFFVLFDRYIAYLSRAQKDRVFGAIKPGVIVEIGAGVGANFEYVPAGSRLVALEPNLAMHADLVARAEQRGIELELHTDGAERMPFADGSVDDVLCSLVLCTVEDQQAVLAEIRRVLKPGGRFRFVEHVAAPRFSPRRWLQHALRRPWSWIYEGCDLCRDTGDAIENAGFSEVQIKREGFRHSVFVPVNSAIHGVAVA